MRKQELIICNHCRKEFLKDSSEVKRNSKLDRPNYCSLNCVGKSRKEEFLKLKRTTSHLNKYNRKDEFSIFRKHLKSIRSRTKISDLSLEDMLEVWNNQKGICIYSGIKLQPAKYIGYNDPRFTMSVDRIDSTKGYIKSNIQFTSLAMNHMKHNMTHEQMVEYINILKNGA